TALVGRAACVLLHAAVLTAVAREPVRNRPVVADLARHAEPAAEEPAPADDAAAEPGARGHHQHVLMSGTGSVDELAPCGGVRVVLDDDRKPGGLLEEIPDRLVVPAQVGCEPHCGAIRVH